MIKVTSHGVCMAGWHLGIQVETGCRCTVVIRTGFTAATPLKSNLTLNNSWYDNNTVEPK